MKLTPRVTIPEGVTATPVDEKVVLFRLSDGTRIVPVAHCELCGRWTRVFRTAPDPMQYPYHREDCEGKWEPVRLRQARVGPPYDVPAGVTLYEMEGYEMAVLP